MRQLRTPLVQRHGTNPPSVQGSSSLAATIRTASRAAARGFRHVRNKTFHGPAVGLGRSKRQPRERRYNAVHVHPGLNGSLKHVQPSSVGAAFGQPRAISSHSAVRSPFACKWRRIS